MFEITEEEAKQCGIIHYPDGTVIRVMPPYIWKRIQEEKINQASKEMKLNASNDKTENNKPASDSGRA